MAALTTSHSLNKEGTDDKAGPTVYINHQEIRTNDLDGLKHVNDQKAAGYVDPTIIISDAENIRLTPKIHRRILPILCIGYLCQAFDKTTLTSASIMGWIEDVGDKGQDFSLTTTLLWIGIIAGEPFVSDLLLSIRYMLTRNVYKADRIGLGFSFNVRAVFGLRFLLGFTESVVSPCMLALMVQWYRVEEQPFVTSIWQAMVGIATTISALISYIISMAFTIFGTTSSVAGNGFTSQQLSSALPALLSSLRYCPIPLPKLVGPLKRKRFTLSNSQGLKQKHWNTAQAREAFTDPFTLCLFALCVFNTLAVRGISTFSGLLVTKAFGFSNLEAQLLSIPIGAMSMITFLTLGFCIRKTNQTRYTMIGFTIPNIIGTIVLLIVEPSNKTKGGLVVAFHIMQFFGACYPATLMLFARNSAGQTKKSIIYAVTFIGWAGGNAVSTQIFQSGWAPRYSTRSTRTILARRNKKKRQGIESRRAAEGEYYLENARAFEDLTDKQNNPDFIYSL
ncbi:hypothetical protein L198_01829 [Cryptococcus wingfieldii CBS 7118]|uniref:Major facilitator superfamily (MFS) profile domain-containing protein n=1 Tax=Cryptococcus wingfieldii CBS 7118 TaxID=1295528 RepID=A0A1E3JWA6_9TREE|nr:hypothetical protein L198_01829 [Cryptococcus wingfieldii CBS 7118]ODO05141.1 hypothetical protein L198_01829 [Cryptococcus wingfieldii CBS 7118]